MCELSVLNIFLNFLGTLWSIRLPHLYGPSHPLLHFYLPASSWDKRQNLWRHCTGIFSQTRSLPGTRFCGHQLSRQQRASTHVSNRKGPHGGPSYRETIRTGVETARTWITRVIYHNSHIINLYKCRICFFNDKIELCPFFWLRMSLIIDWNTCNPDQSWLYYQSLKSKTFFRLAFRLVPHKKINICSSSQRLQDLGVLCIEVNPEKRF